MSAEICKKKGAAEVEQKTLGKWFCSECNMEIEDETEFTDNDGICDDCHSMRLKKRIGLIKEEHLQNS